MAQRKTATKTSRKATANVHMDIDKKSKRKMQTTLKNMRFKVLALAFVFLLVGIFIGGGVWWFVCKDDCFALVGKDEIILTLQEEYVDEGVKIVAFGKDERASVKISSNIPSSENGKYTSGEVGTFYIKYESTCFKYGKLFKVQKVRLVTFVEASEGEIDEQQGSEGES